MLAVIFQATIAVRDDEYTATAKRMRELALSQSGCIEFVSVSEGKTEISISYWPDAESIARWKANPEHRRAQQLGRERWYRSYRVQIVNVERVYQHGGAV